MTFINPNEFDSTNLSMKTKIILIFILLIGFSAFMLHDHSSPTGKASKSDSKNQNESAGIERPEGSLPEIDFSLLGEARPIDLIDLALEFPESLKKLNGQRVSIVGFMAPFDSLENMRRCQVVPSYVGCTFCSPPNLREVVFVTQGSEENSDKSYSFIEEPSFVTGIFRISLPGSYHEGKKQGFVYSIEEAEVSAYSGEAPERAPSHATPGGHNSGKNAPLLPPTASAELLREVSEILGFKPIHPISIERVSAQTFGNLIRAELDATYPMLTRAYQARTFSLLGLLPSDGDWMEILSGFALGQSSASSDQNGRRVLVLDSVPLDHPFVRLDLVRALADALIRQSIVKDFNGMRTVPKENEDARRAKEALRVGLAKVASRRYARSRSISPKVPPPDEFVAQGSTMGKGSLLDLWHSLPADIGPFFVNFLVGTNGPLREIKSALARPPSSLMEFLRPLWYENSSLWKRNPVPNDFADKVMQNPPNSTGVLGIGSLIPWLAHKNSSYAARNISGQWAGDRWAVWEYSDGSAALLLETRWQSEEAALKFRDAIPDHPFQWHFPYEPESSTVRLLRGTSPEALNRQDPFAQ